MKNELESKEITASIVLYKNDKTFLSAVESFINTDLNIRLYLIDNSPSPLIKDELTAILTDKRIEYFFCNQNLGYAKGHNLAFSRAKISNSKYHLILNPDIEFEEGVLEQIFAFMENNQDIGQLMPKILYRNGELQKLCKLLPTPFNLIGRRFFQHYKWAENLNKKYELENFSYNHTLDLPNLSGCFMFIRTDILQRVGGFDDRFFMYLEDIDLTRRINRIARTIFYPGVEVYHGYEKESYSNPVLLKYHIKSAIQYFNKWGWLFDKERTKLNNEVLKELSLRKEETLYQKA